MINFLETLLLKFDIMSLEDEIEYITILSEAIDKAKTTDEIDRLLIELGELRNVG